MKTNRLKKLFDPKKKQKVFSVYVTLGYTSLKHTENVLLAAEKEGVNLIELGFPFSDPLADGPVIQESSYLSLSKTHVHFNDAVKLISKLRKKGFQVPVLFFSYYNPIQKIGEEKVVRELAAAGFDGFLIPDLPPEEGEDFHRKAKKKGLSLIYFLSPTSSPERIRMVSKKTDEFIYYVSSRGVTGIRKNLDKDLEKKLKTIKRLAKKPVVIGFGISNSEKVKQAARISNGAIVGTALIKEMKRDGSGPGGIKKTARFIKSLRSGIPS